MYFVIIFLNIILNISLILLTLFFSFVDNFLISFKYLSNFDDLFDIYIVKINKDSKKYLNIKYEQFNSKNILIKD